MQERKIIVDKVIDAVDDIDIDTLIQIVKCVRDKHMSTLSYGELLEYAKECGVDAE